MGEHLISVSVVNILKRSIGLEKFAYFVVLCLSRRERDVPLKLALKTA